MGRTGQERTQTQYRSSVSARGESARASPHARGYLGLQVADVVAAFADVLLMLVDCICQTGQQR